MSDIFSIESGVVEGAFSAWIEVSGPDSEVFLQGQGTQDFRRMQPGEVRRSLWLSLKGKVLGESVVLRTERSWWLWSAHTAARVLTERLEEFIIADDVTVTDFGSGWRHWTLVGRNTLQALELGEPPARGAWRGTAGGGLLFQGRRGLPEVWEWLIPASGGAAVVPPGVRRLSHEALERARIAAGQPAIPDEFGANDLPQEAGLEHDAISFTKGCYLGQEVMARLHAMGQVRRRLVRLSGDGEPPAVGVELSQGGKRRGEVRAAAVALGDARPSWVGLGMVTLLGFDPAGGLSLPDGRPVRVVGVKEGAA